MIERKAPDLRKASDFLTMTREKLEAIYENLEFGEEYYDDWSDKYHADWSDVFSDPKDIAECEYQKAIVSRAADRVHKLMIDIYEEECRSKYAKDKGRGNAGRS